MADPQNIGNYQILRPLGRGGMASVYLAQDPRFNREVAIKLLPRQFLHDPNFKLRFEREAQTIASLEHPAIVPVYDYGEDDGQPYLVMRYMPGGSLVNRIANGPLPLSEAAKIIARIGSALEEAHRKGVIHRDLKPGNILFDHLGNAYLGDFGIVKLVSDTNTFTGTGSIIGTPAYMSPEQARGREKLDGRSDIYALGAILFEMLTGRQPYEADTPMGLAVAQMTEPVPQIRQVDPHMPEHVDQVIQKSMAKNRDDRFATAGEMASSLTGQPAGPPTPIPTPTPQPIRQPPPTTPQPKDTVFEPTPLPVGSSDGRSRPILPWILGVLGVILLIGGPWAYFSFFAGGSPSDAEPTAVAEQPLDESGQETPDPLAIQPSTPTAEPGDQPPATPTGSDTDLPGVGKSFVLILPGRLGDDGYSDMAQRGAKRALDELGVDGMVVETAGPAEQEAALNRAIETGIDLILPLSLDEQLVLDVAAGNPEQQFGLPSDFFGESAPDNVAAFQIDTHQAAFLIGVVAGSLSESQQVGAVVGADIPNLNQFVFGYRQGVLEVCPTCLITIDYLDFEFDDPERGYAVANGQYDQGVDIIFQIAGRTGLGVLRAAAERDRFAIGVDANQDNLQPGHVIVSMIKRVDNTTFALIDQMVRNELAGGFTRVGLAEEAVGLSWDGGSDVFARFGPERLTGRLPEVKEQVEAYRSRILSGELEVCNILDPRPICDAITAVQPLNGYSLIERARAGEFSGTSVEIVGVFANEEAAAFQETIAIFGRETGIDITYQTSSAFEAEVVTRIYAGDAPDIVAHPQPGLVSGLAQQGFVFEPVSFLGADFLRDNYDQSWLQASMIDGQISGVWFRTSVKSLVWYAKDDFEAAGFREPETWQELIGLSELIAVEFGQTPWCIGIESGGATGWPATDWVEDILLRTQPPDVYDAWVRGELPFNSPEVTRALQTMEIFWREDAFVNGGAASIAATPVQTAHEPLFDNPPGCWFYRQSSFIPALFPANAEIGGNIDFFLFPMIDEAYGTPIVIAGDMMVMHQDRPEVQAVMAFLATGEAARESVERGVLVAPHKTVDLAWYPNELGRRYAALLQNADTIRFDASDNMPAAVGAGAFWEQMTAWVNGQSIEETLTNIDRAWPR